MYYLVQFPYSVGIRKKCLFFGIKNKHCIICHQSSQLNDIIIIYYKNWNSTSTSMELNIIIESFKESISMHNLIYNKLIGDSDSTVTKQSILTKVYGPNIVIKKIQCTNHLLRIYINQLRDMAIRCKCTSGIVVPGVQRSYFKKTIYFVFGYRNYKVSQ